MFRRRFMSWLYLVNLSVAKLKLFTFYSNFPKKYGEGIYKKRDKNGVTLAQLKCWPFPWLPDDIFKFPLYLFSYNCADINATWKYASLLSCHEKRTKLLKNSILTGNIVIKILTLAHHAILIRAKVAWNGGLLCPPKDLKKLGIYKYIFFKRK